MADDERHEGGGFDDWLEEEPGPDSDPYASLASEDDDAETEIAEWMAFTEGETSSADAPSDEGPVADAGSAPDPSADDAAMKDEPTDAPGDDDAGLDDLDQIATFQAISVEESTAEPPSSASDEPSGDAVDAAEETHEIPAVEATEEPPVEQVPATTVEVDEFDGGARADTEEVPILAAADVVEATIRTDAPADDDAGLEMAADTEQLGTEQLSEDALEEAALEPEDTGEIDVIGDDLEEPDDTGELEVVAFPEPVSDADLRSDEDHPAEAGPDDAGRDAADDDAFDLSQEQYLQGGTKEHAGLAAAIADAEGKDTEQVALAAPIPGLESTVVGFDDVVEAEGHGKVRARRGGDLLARVITAIVLIAALAASLVWRPALLALATVVFIIGAGEFYTALTRSGRHPISLFGFAGVLGASIGAYVWGAVAIPATVVIVAVLLLMFYAVVPNKTDPMANLALTITVMVWVSLGTYAMMIVVAEDYRPLVVGVVVVVAAMDIAQYFVGRTLGRHQLSPWVSPKKTVEGLVGGVIVALGLGALLHFVPPFELTSGLAVGAAVAILSPLGDLAMSAAKRALDIKDMGSILPGHGGFLDRIDGLLFVIPAAWAIFLWTGLI